MTPPNRAALEHENWIAYLTGVAGCSASVDVRRTGGVVSLRSSVPFDWFNQVLVERDDATASQLLDAAGPDGRGSPDAVIRLRTGTDDHLVPGLARAGWFVTGPERVTPGMVAFPIDHLSTAVPDLPGFEIRRVTDADGIEDHRAVVTDGFGSAPSVAVESTGLDLLARPACVVYVGYADDQPVTSGLGWRSGRTIGVYAISTAPAARRRGYGEAMTVRVVADGIAAGCDVAVLQASEAGRPIYERLGFRVDVRYHPYARRVETG